MIGVFVTEGALDSYVRAKLSVTGFAAREAAGWVRTKHMPFVWCVLCTVTTEKGVVQVSLAGRTKLVYVRAYVWERYAV